MKILYKVTLGIAIALGVLVVILLFSACILAIIGMTTENDTVIVSGLCCLAGTVLDIILWAVFSIASDELKRKIDVSMIGV